VGDDVDTVERLVERSGEQVVRDQLEARLGRQRLDVAALAIGVVERREGVEPAHRAAASEQ
jgi:hypothetical protein